MNPINPVNLSKLPKCDAKARLEHWSKQWSALNQERVWWDANNPNFGNGSFN
jgi:hypothetical protein